MWKRICSLIAAGLLFCTAAFAQEGEYLSYTPYSIFGVGDLFGGTSSAYNAGMGGVGVASRNRRYLNTINPAAIAVRDSLAFMVDFSLFNKNTLYSQDYNGIKRNSANNLTNIGGFAVSFPIWNKLAGVLGLRPYSSVGYSMTYNHVDAENGVVVYSHSGLGSLYNAYGGVAIDLWKRFSIGAEADYIFGKIEKNAVQNFLSSGYNEAQSYYTLTLNAFTGKLGLQYEQPLSKELRLGFGATYGFAAKVRGFNEGKFYSAGSVQNITLPSSYADTLGNDSGIRLADELNLGISLNYSDKFRAEFNYSRSDWRDSGMDYAKGFSIGDAEQPFVNSVKESYRLGMEYVPNLNDVRYYYRRIAYRAGAYYNNEYYSVAGQKVNTIGLTFGITLPVFRWYNGLSITLDAGRRGPFKGSMVRENFLKFTFGVNLFDIWFQQPRYD
ncbi:MAG: hypothetical protein GX899_02205 [Rikenellaceae bacterium]|jgi:hypothetical protein|nr:hypothetical protein [Rikenellaceae bacterium]